MQYKKDSCLYDALNNIRTGIDSFYFKSGIDIIVGGFDLGMCKRFWNNVNINFLIQ